MLLAHTPFNIFTESSSGPHAVKILICSFFVILQNMRVAPVPLRICCLSKSMKIVDVLKTNGKAMILDGFCVSSSSICLLSTWCVHFVPLDREGGLRVQRLVLNFLVRFFFVQR